jgi:hypothetical protein
MADEKPTAPNVEGGLYVNTGGEKNIGAIVEEAPCVTTGREGLGASSARGLFTKDRHPTPSASTINS